MRRKPFLLLVSSLLIGLWGLETASNDPLSFEERVKAQEAMERVYYSHRVWPKENPAPKPPFEQMVPKEVLEDKVNFYLKESAALDEFWQRPLTGDQLQAEMDRMAKNTKDPETLKELFAALNNDPYLIAECLARPVIADRLCRNWYAYDDRFHGEVKKEIEALRAGLTVENFAEAAPEKYRAVILILKNESAKTEDAENMGSLALDPEDFEREVKKFPEPGQISQVEETAEAFVIRLTEMKTAEKLEGGVIAFQKIDFADWFLEASPSLTLPVLEHFCEFATPKTPEGATPSSPDSWKSIWSVPFPRGYHTAIWTGNEMIIWGGTSHYGSDYFYLNDGGRYNPGLDIWTPTSTVNAPSERYYHAAVWTGSEMIVWGGCKNEYDTGSWQNTGGRYNPDLDSWTATNTTNAPSARIWPTAVWTGNEMIVWGGYGTVYVNTGARYNPSLDTWQSTSTTGVPSARGNHTAVWTGSEMIVWGGGNPLTNTGGRYNPSTNSWTATSTGTNCPSSRRGHVAVWTGTEMIIWGSAQNTGGKYNPSTNTWLPTSTGTNCPSGRQQQTGVWTGTEMIVWGGLEDGTGLLLNTGGRYNPSLDSWIATNTTNAPSARHLQTAVWTGAEMIVWGGYDTSYLNNGNRYNPSTNTWTSTSTGLNVPLARQTHSAVWTGTEMIIWGGGGDLNTGGRYNSSSDSWATISTGTNCPSGRCWHTAVWTGTEMIIWGGSDGSTTQFNTGGRYNPINDTWTATSTGTNCPSGRLNHTAVWTGNEVIIWGGWDNYGGATYFNTGGKYNPSNNTWTATSTGSDCPSARKFHTAVWTGTEMIVWGGRDDLSTYNTGGRYNPTLNSWTATSITNAPSAREQFTFVWTGTEMIIWGGSGDLNTGGRYNPSNDTWTATSTGTNCPSGRYSHTAVWTGTEMIVWGGYDNTGSPLNTGGRYNLSSDAWIATSTGTNCPVRRWHHTAVWTGGEMIVWGGGDPLTNSGGTFYPNTPPRSIFSINTSLGGDTVFTLGKGETLSLNGSASTDGSNFYTTTSYHDDLDSIVSYQWDLNGDAGLGVNCAGATAGFDRNVAVPPVLTEADLQTLGITTPGDHPIWLRVTDEVGATSCASNTLTIVDKAPPAVQVVSPNGGESWPYSESDTQKLQYLIAWNASDNNNLKRTVISYTSGTGSWTPIVTLEHTGNFTSEDTPKTILDNNPSGTSSAISVPAGEVVQDIDVVVNIQHTRDSDLTLYLIGPDSTQIRLSQMRGGNGDNYSGTTFDDEGIYSIALGAAPFTGKYKPEDSLTAFDGKTCQGNWTLKVVDSATGETGTLQSWSLSFVYAPKTSYIWAMPTQAGAALDGQTFPTSSAKIRVQVWDDSDNNTTDASDSPFYIIQPTSTAVQTLILTDTDRIASSGLVYSKLVELSNNKKVNGVILDLKNVSSLSDPSTGIYHLWDLDPTSVTAANAVADGIRDYIVTSWAR